MDVAPLQDDEMDIGEADPVRCLNYIDPEVNPTLRILPAISLHYSETALRKRLRRGNATEKEISAMNANWTTDVRCFVLLLAALATPALRAQTTPLCNGLPATIVATVSGVIMGTPGDDVIVGTAGNDKIFGLGGNDTICGLGGNDEITGGPGTDKLFGQEGNDTFFWMPGDGSDLIEGAGDNDTVAMLGSGATEAFELSANGGRVRLFRDVAAVTLDIADV